jgi:hypothetical protein
VGATAVQTLSEGHELLPTLGNDLRDGELADIIERVLAAPNHGGHRHGRRKVMLLTPPGDPETITLPRPIKHLARGRGQAFVRRQRYTSEGRSTVIQPRRPISCGTSRRDGSSR